LVQTLDGDYSLFHAKPYFKHKDAFNDGLFCKIKRGGEIVEMGNRTIRTFRGLRIDNTLYVTFPPPIEM
jgi:hypothetical protein